MRKAWYAKRFECIPEEVIFQNGSVNENAGIRAKYRSSLYHLKS